MTREGLSTGPPKLAMREPKREPRRRRCSAVALGGKMKLLLLLVPCIVALWVPLYNSTAPALFGIPFFYWFQLLLIPISAVTIYAADRIGKR